jgi:hypothetical protein
VSANKRAAPSGACEANSALGWRALKNLTTGSRNIGVGRQVGYNISTGNDNIHIGHEGNEESGVIRIGTAGTHTKAYVAGIVNSTGGTYEAHVAINGQLVKGDAVVSSRRYKREIRDTGDISDRLHRLRPVAFRFVEELEGADQRPQFGLIAEEVAQVLPELVSYDQDGRVHSVRQRPLTALLLKELQKEHRQNRVQWALIGALFLAVAALTVVRWRFG